MPAPVNFFKLRASWAQVGSSTVAPESINRIYTFTAGGFNGIPVQNAPNNLQNPDIRPLTVTTSEGGFEVQFLQNRLSVDATYYNRVTTNDILQPAISPTSGYLAGNQNVGKISNKGIELLISGRPFRTKDFSWNASFNFAYNQSRILELAPGIKNLTIGTGISSAVSIVNAVGLPYGSVLGWKMKKDANGVQVYNATSGYEDRYQDYLGVANPPYIMGLSNSFTYKKFTMSVLLDAKFGAVAFNNMWVYAMRFGLTKSTLPGRETGVQLDGVDQSGQKFSKLWPVVDLDTYYNNRGANYSELATFNTDFVKLRSFILNYSLPVGRLKFVKIQSASIGFVARNLAIIYRDKKVKDAGLDPEMQQTVANATGTAGAGEPRTRTMGFNLNIKF
jgi:outer membrane receptor protein involved in Fe transport